MLSARTRVLQYDQYLFSCLASLCTPEIELTKFCEIRYCCIVVLIPHTACPRRKTQEGKKKHDFVFLQTIPNF